jgi:hypothetical protein
MTSALSVLGRLLSASVSVLRHVELLWCDSLCQLVRWAQLLSALVPQRTVIIPDMSRCTSSPLVTRTASRSSKRESNIIIGKLAAQNG